ncbi:MULTISPECIES: hypothetical protein [unclassified Coleofasciculus]|uniref:hypothetical protein n=1 Tax=Cyanophyceae TaxID=3028117 RepID=UPI001683E80E|nr:MULTISPECIES: hypothetical protein [unclassified Coleofasciculus]MBD1841073.1 hypothetical protein [Coleofasciculus sp. FACHB-501]MBD1877916.1 hypothetical protein [Coleofasciculus sp. FACHB-T130]MBD1900578.1 hypothetical protein [Coleofasciculus sp. FACHB-125]MBD1943054.1 hypothetical protein [Coleofasciculus sp. FACHB-712]MBD2087152.1 hypothetical protein [Coleofasciculus sp. FACHB-542]
MSVTLSFHSFFSKGFLPISDKESTSRQLLEGWLVNNTTSLVFHLEKANNEIDVTEMPDGGSNVRRQEVT